MRRLWHFHKGTVLGTITLLKIGVECPCTDRNKLMGASSGSDFLTFCGIMDRLGLTISCVPVRVGELEVPMKFELWRVNLAVATAVLTSRGVELSMPVRLTSLGVRKMPATLRAVSVTISFGSTVWRASKLSHITCTSSVTSWSIRQISPWMIFGTNRFFGNFCVDFPLVV